MPTSTSKKNGRATTVNDVMKEFSEAYSDAVNDWTSPEEWTALDARRQLTWVASRRIPLSNASWLYSLMSHGYNLYRPHMIPHLWSAFHRDKIEVTPAREYSVAIYLHVPDAPGLRQRVEAFCNGHFNADVVN